MVLTITPHFFILCHLCSTLVRFLAQIWLDLTSVISIDKKYSKYTELSSASCLQPWCMSLPLTVTVSEIHWCKTCWIGDQMHHFLYLSMLCGAQPNWDVKHHSLPIYQYTSSITDLLTFLHIKFVSVNAPIIMCRIVLAYPNLLSARRGYHSLHYTSKM